MQPLIMEVKYKANGIFSLSLLASLLPVESIFFPLLSARIHFFAFPSSFRPRRGFEDYLPFNLLIHPASGPLS